MFVYKAMTALAETGGSVSFALPDNRLHCLLKIEPEGGETLLRVEVLSPDHALEGDVHRAESLDGMKAFLLDPQNEKQVRFAIRKLWDRMEGR